MPRTTRLATSVAHASCVVANGLSVVLLGVVAVAAEGADSPGPLVVSEALRALIAALRSRLRTILSEMIMPLTVAAGDPLRSRRRAEGVNVVGRSAGVRSAF